MKRRRRMDSRAWLAAWLLASLLCTATPMAFAEDAAVPPAAAAAPPSAPAADTRSGGIDDESRTVAIGTTDLLDVDFDPDPAVVIGSKTILGDVSVDPGNPRRFRVTPMKKGTSSLIINSVNKRDTMRVNYNVIANDLSTQVMAIRRLLQDIEGITIDSVGDKIVIDGELVVPRDLDRVLQVESAYKENVLVLASLSKLSREAIAKRMQKEINDDPGGVNVTVRIINDTFFLFGKVDSKPDADRAETIAQTYLPEIMGSTAIQNQALTLGAKKFAIRNMIQTEEPPPAPAPRMVRVTYHFVEIGKEYLKQSFFKWVPLLNEGAGVQIGNSTTGGVQSQTNGTLTGTITSLIPKLQSGSSGGFARILFSTVQLTEDKVQTEVVRTEEIPYVGAVVNGVPVSANAKVGITIQTTPEIQGDKVRLACKFSFSSAVGNGAGGQPQTVTSASQNTVILKSGESSALSGLISSQSSKTVDKDPEAAGAGSGSPIFTLLRSKAFNASKSQFVIFVTPKIIEDASEGTADIKAKILNNSTKKRRRTIQ